MVTYRVVVTAVSLYRVHCSEGCGHGKVIAPGPCVVIHTYTAYNMATAGTHVHLQAHKEPQSACRCVLSSTPTQPCHTPGCISLSEVYMCACLFMCRASLAHQGRWSAARMCTCVCACVCVCVCVCSHTLVHLYSQSRLLFYLPCSTLGQRLTCNAHRQHV